MPAAYQDENEKWYKQCSKTKQIFGPVDTKEELSQWFVKGNCKDGFRSVCKEVDKDKKKERNRKYQKENLDKIRKAKRYYNKTAAGLLSKHKKSAKKRGINFTLTREWYEEQMTKPEFNICAISGIKFVDSSDPNEPFARSLDRISSTKGYTPDNVRWICFSHNSWKSDMTVWDMARIFKYTAQSHNLDPVEILNQVS